MKRNNVEGKLMSFDFNAREYSEFLIGTMDSFKKTKLPMSEVQEALILLIFDQDVFPPGHLIQSLREKLK